MLLIRAASDGDEGGGGKNCPQMWGWSPGDACSPAADKPLQVGKSPLPSTGPQRVRAAGGWAGAIRGEVSGLSPSLNTIPPPPLPPPLPQS